MSIFKKKIVYFSLQNGMGVTFSASQLFLRERSFQKALGEARDRAEAAGLSLMHVIASQYPWFQKYLSSAALVPFLTRSWSEHEPESQDIFKKRLLFQCQGPMYANKAHIQAQAAPPTLQFSRGLRL